MLKCDSTDGATNEFFCSRNVALFTKFAHMKSAHFPSVL